MGTISVLMCGSRINTDWFPKRPPKSKLLGGSGACSPGKVFWISTRKILLSHSDRIFTVCQDHLTDFNLETFWFNGILKWVEIFSSLLQLFYLLKYITQKTNMLKTKTKQGTLSEWNKLLNNWNFIIWKKMSL